MRPSFMRFFPLLLLAVLTLASAIFSGRAQAQTVNVTLEKNQALLRELAERRDAVRAAGTPEEKAALQRQIQRWLNERERDALEQSLNTHLFDLKPQESDWLWFWTNHFSVFSKKGNIRLLLSDYENAGIRPHLYGHFSELLKSAVLHPAMLMYLDNVQNRKGHHNENLAREILELHTVGINGGYTQADIQTLAQALSGITVWTRQALPSPACDPPACKVLHPAGTILLIKQHATGKKWFMGKTYADDDGLAILGILDDLARHPKTVERLSSRLLQYHVQDTPTPEQLNFLADTWKQSRGDLQHISTALENIGKNTKTEPRIKDPFRHLRAIAQTVSANCEGAVRVNTSALRQALERLGMGLYQRISPDGYPLSASYWNSGDTLVQRLDTTETLVRQMSRGGRADSRLMQHCATRLRQHASDHTRMALEELQAAPLQWMAVYLVSPDVMFH